MNLTIFAWYVGGWWWNEDYSYTGTGRLNSDVTAEAPGSISILKNLNYKFVGFQDSEEIGNTGTYQSVFQTIQQTDEYEELFNLRLEKEGYETTPVYFIIHDFIYISGYYIVNITYYARLSHAGYRLYNQVLTVGDIYRYTLSSDDYFDYVVEPEGSVSYNPCNILFTIDNKLHVIQTKIPSYEPYYPWWQTSRFDGTNYDDWTIVSKSTWKSLINDLTDNYLTKDYLLGLAKFTDSNDCICITRLLLNYCVINNQAIIEK